jgi:hypothetical protein
MAQKQSLPMEQGGSRPKIPQLRLVFMETVVYTPLLPYLDRRCLYMVKSHDVQAAKNKGKKIL